MLKLALIFLAIGLVLSLLGFGGFVSGTLIQFAYVFLAIFVILIVVKLIGGNVPSDPGV